MPINLERRALVGLGLLWLGGVRAFAATDVIGVWSATVQMKEANLVGEQMIVTATEVIFVDGVLADATYEIDGAKLTVTAVDERLGPPEVREVKIEGAKMIVTTSESKGRVMTRRGQPYQGAHPIVGDWTWPFLGSIRFVERYSRKGNAQFGMVVGMQKGAYRLEGETMRIELAKKLPFALTVRREGNALTTWDEAGKETRFVKFEY